MACSSSVHSKNQSDIPAPGLILPNQSPPNEEFRITPLSNEEAGFRHSGWAQRRRLVWESLQRTHATAQRQDRFANCGSGCVVEWSQSTKRARLRGNYCHDRLCMPCGRARSARVAAALTREAAGRQVRFATFTLRHSQTPLTAQIDRLYRSFALLKRRAFFKEHCTGGAAILEAKIGVDGLWHVHLHTLLCGRFMDQKTLCEEWHAVTGDSYIIDIRRIDDAGQAIKYCASYVGKPMDATVVTHSESLDEFAIAIKGRRVCNTWGCWGKLDLDAPDPAAPTDWISVGSLQQLLYDAARGDKWAQALLMGLTGEEHHQHPTHDAGSLFDPDS